MAPSEPLSPFLFVCCSFFQRHPSLSLSLCVALLFHRDSDFKDSHLSVFLSLYDALLFQRDSDFKDQITVSLKLSVCLLRGSQAVTGSGCGSEMT